MHMELKPEIVYGPVKSRRFGWDLGINLLPRDYKLCTFNCLYCQYGFTPTISNQKFRFPSAEEVIQSLTEKLEVASKRGIEVRHFTVCGHGEPTMHPKFETIAEQLAQWKTQVGLPIALLSNGYRLKDERIRCSLKFFDQAVIKLDSAVPSTFALLNNPAFPFSLNSFIDLLSELKGIGIQTLFVKNYNDSEFEIRKWMEALRMIRPDHVQIYTLDRPPARLGLKSISVSELRRIAQTATAFAGLPVVAYV